MEPCGAEALPDAHREVFLCLCPACLQLCLQIKSNLLLIVCVLFSYSVVSQHAGEVHTWGSLQHPRGDQKTSNQCSGKELSSRLL